MKGVSYISSWRRSPSQSLFLLDINVLKSCNGAPAITAKRSVSLMRLDDAMLIRLNNGMIVDCWYNYIPYKMHVLLPVMSLLESWRTLVKLSRSHESDIVEQIAMLVWLQSIVVNIEHFIRVEPNTYLRVTDPFKCGMKELGRFIESTRKNTISYNMLLLTYFSTKFIGNILYYIK